MKSSERPHSRATFVALFCIAICALAITALRPRLTERFQRLRVISDVYALPSAEQLVVASLGYRAALADLLFTSTLISYGIHFQEKRRFEYAGLYLEAVATLDPSFRTPFLFADTLIVMQSVPARMEEYTKARELLERGMHAFPHDAEIWLNAGQYMAYLAAPHFGDAKLKEKWRLDAARILAKACEFVSDNDNIPYHCLSAAALFSKAGEQEASIRMLERVIAVTDDDEVRARALMYLERANDEQRRQQIESRHRRFREVWGADLRFANKNLVLLVGPPFDPARCAGVAKAGSADCATSWRAWFEHLPFEAQP